MPGVGLGGGGRGDTIAPRLLVPRIASDPAWQESLIVRGVSSYRTIVFYILQEGFGAPSQLRLRLNWYHDEGAVGIPYAAVRRDAAQNLVADEPLLPVTAGGVPGLYAVAVANPGGATGVSIGFQSAANSPDVEIYYSGES
jgi:hypothetical protein